MRDVERALESLATASGLSGVLAASWDAFDVLVAGCQHGERASGAGDMFAPYAFAATAAAEGRAVIMTAPSIPSGYPATTSDTRFAGTELASLAIALAGLARALHERLASAADEAAAAAQAVAEADRLACTAGAVQAALVHGLLARGED
jgi:hypothetical protein